MEIKEVIINDFPGTEFDNVEEHDVGIGSENPIGQSMKQDLSTLFVDENKKPIQKEIDKHMSKLPITVESIIENTSLLKESNNIQTIKAVEAEE